MIEYAKKGFRDAKSMLNLFENQRSRDKTVREV